MGSSRPKPKRLSEKLAYIRKAFGLTQQQMVEALKRKQSNATVYPGNISRFEQGIREPPLLVLLAYAKLARTTIDTLVDDEVELPRRLITKV